MTLLHPWQAHKILIAVAVLLVQMGCGANPHAAEPAAKKPREKPRTQVTPQNSTNDMSDSTPKTELQKATFGGGCFWCTEAVYQQLKGVESVVSGYSGGKTENPTYEQISRGDTGHAEVIQVTYDPAVVSYPELLEVFWATHDPTTPNQQGYDVGTQYRSVIFYQDDEQRKLAEQYKEKLGKAGAFEKPIVTEISPLTKFYPAEKYHQDFYNLNPDQPYCKQTIPPKLAKLRKVFKDKLKK